MDWMNVNWWRSAEPILRALDTGQPWCRVTLYNPSVVRVGGIYRMWFVGNASASRSGDQALGYAESEDGLTWRPYEGNPIATPEDIPWGMNWQTPQVMFDHEEGLYKMWFVSTTVAEREDDGTGLGRYTNHDQALGYATSEDGARWDVHPEPLYPSGRGPSVLKEGSGRYRMWMCSRPGPQADWQLLYRNIYEFTSPDGLAWTRADEPAVQTPLGPLRSCVYPHVFRDAGGYVMLFGSHIERGFEIYHATSADGTHWRVHDEQAVLPASHNEALFDGRYTSTPCLLAEPDRYLLYYSARPLQDEYIDGDGVTRVDGCGIYNAIGVAVAERGQAVAPDLSVVGGS